MRRFFVLPAVFLVLAGCQEDPVGPVSVECADVLTSFQPLSGDTVTTAEGVRYFDVQSGGGQPAALGSTVDVNYSLYTLGGSALDTSCESTDTVLRFIIGQQGILAGFQIGVIGMREGGVRRVVLPVELGYPQGHPIGNQELVFDIELVATN